MEVRPFRLSIFLEFTKFVVLSVPTLIKTICTKIWTNSLLKNAKSPLSVDVRRSENVFLVSSLLALLECLQPWNMEAS